MGTTIDITEIVVAIIGLLSVIVTAVVVPLLRKKYGDEKMAEMMNWVDIAVKAAEQLFQGSKRGQERLQYVLDFLREKGFDVDSEEVRNAIEAAVFEMNNSFADVFVEETIEEDIDDDDLDDTDEEYSDGAE